MKVKGSHISSLLLMALVLALSGCELMLPKVNSNYTKRGKYLTVTEAGIVFTCGSQRAESFIKMDIKKNAPKEMYLLVMFQTPGTNKIVRHAVSLSEYQSGKIRLKCKECSGWRKQTRYKIRIEVYSDQACTLQLETITQTWAA